MESSISIFASIVLQVCNKISVSLKSAVLNWNLWRISKWSTHRSIRIVPKWSGLHPFLTADASRLAEVAVSIIHLSYWSVCFSSRWMIYLKLWALSLFFTDDFNLPQSYTIGNILRNPWRRPVHGKPSPNDEFTNTRGRLLNPSSIGLK